MTDAEYTRARIAYNTETGAMTWKIKPSRGVDAGDKTGATLDKGGYLRVKLFGKQHLAHRVAWLITYGEWPSYPLDHINGVRHDNRLSNLRLSSRSLNGQNQRAARKSQTGLLGVSREGTKFKARIILDKKYYYLGCFATPQEAHEVYLQAKRRLHAGCTI